ncbi:MAG: haloacid dehalogenase [Desulfobacterales bacterium]|nr:MAG: haloacid dehalogenase [Desulfobacterales bacterium]
MDVTQLKAVVFDCDGVMFDTALCNRKFYDAILDAFGKAPLNDEQFINVHMMTVKAAIKYLFPEMDDYRPVYLKIKEIEYASFIPYMRMEEGLPELLMGLKAAGVFRGVATNRTNTMDRVLHENHLTNAFEMVVTAADVEHPKPSPEQLEKIMAAHGFEPKEMLFVGDSLYDQEAANSAGTWFAAFKSPGLDAHFHVDTMAEIGVLLNIDK